MFDFGIKKDSSPRTHQNSTELMSALRIRDTQKTQLLTIRDGGDELFEKLSFAIVENEKPSIRASELYKTVLRTGASKEYARAFLTQMIGLATFRRSRQKKTTDVIDQLIEGLKVADFDEEAISWFSERRTALEKILLSDSIRMPSKALNLSIDQTSIFRSGNVVTDIRPIFFSDREKIGGAIVVQSLRLHFLEDSGMTSERAMSLALDNEDIDNLIEELQKAKRKAEACKMHLASNGDDAYIVGEENFDFS